LIAEVIKGKLQTASREFTMRVHDIPGLKRRKKEGKWRERNNLKLR
jgi:hypothetical protein